MDAAGGGGYRDPGKRDPGALMRDIAEERVSQGAALRDYGKR